MNKQVQRLLKEATGTQTELEQMQEEADERNAAIGEINAILGKGGINLD